MLQFHPMHVKRSHISRWLTGLLALCVVGLAQSMLLAAGPPKSSEEQPIYTPPKKITPRARVGGDVRGTDGSDPEVKALVPDHPAFNYPNKIGAAAWANWVQERGLYFLGEKDPKYVDLVSMTDSFQDNPGEKLGSLVEARIGKGRWLYLGLALWRQLPAGTVGAYELLANLLSLPKAPSGTAAP